jgi:UDP-glucose 4-epimerase
LASAYTELLGLKVLILRLANVVGPRSRHGVIYDFINKLRANHRELEILGDGKQTKSYLHIDDCIDAHTLALDDRLWSNRTDVYNVGSDDRIDVLSIARIVAETLNLNDVKYKLSKRTGERA